MRLVAFLLLPITMTCVAQGNQPYLEDNRRGYISNVLRAFYEASAQDIANTYEYLNVAERNNCRSSNSDLRTECLLSYAQQNCDTISIPQDATNCELFSDVMVVNKMSQNAFITRSERFRILSNTGADGRSAIESRLQQRYARIVTDFSLTDAANCGITDFACLARRLDNFCLDYANTQSLSWQHCVGAAVWFIGTAK